MITVNLISYSGLSQLRLREMVGGIELDFEESGMQVLVGLGGYERYGDTMFCWRQGEAFKTAGIELDLSPTSMLSVDLAAKIIKTIGLPVESGMSASELSRLFGTSDIDTNGSVEPRLLRFVCNEREPYVVGFQVHQQHGLINLFLARKDYCDAEDAL